MSRKFLGISVFISLLAGIGLFVLSYKLNEKHKTSSIANLIEFEYSDINNFENLITSDTIQLYENYKSQFEENDEIINRYFSDSSKMTYNNIIFSYLCLEIFKRIILEVKLNKMSYQNELIIEVILTDIGQNLFIELIYENGKLKIKNIFPLKPFVYNFLEIFNNDILYLKLLEDLKELRVK